MSQYLDPKTDIVFKKIFGEHPVLLKSFLNAILPLPENGLIASLEYLASEHVPVIPTFKWSIVDVKCRDLQGRVFIVEMQMQWTPFFMQRMLFNASTAYVRQLEKGEQYKMLHPVYGLALCDYVFDKETPHFYHHYKLVNVENPKRTIKDLQLVFIELPKFQPSSFSQKKLQVLWLRFMSELDERTQVVPQELLEVEEIKQAVDLSRESALSPGELNVYEKYWDSVRIEKGVMSDYYECGMEEGLAQGLEQALERGLEQGLAKGKLMEKQRLADKLASIGIEASRITEIME